MRLARVASNAVDKKTARQMIADWPNTVHMKETAHRTVRLCNTSLVNDLDIEESGINHMICSKPRRSIITRDLRQSNQRILRIDNKILQGIIRDERAERVLQKKAADLPAGSPADTLVFDRSPY